MPRYKTFSFESWDGLWSTQDFQTAADVEVPPWRIDNVVSTFKMSDTLDLLEIAKTLFFLEYNCSKFTAATLRLKHPGTTALSFSSGSVVCTGAKSIEESRRAAGIYVEIFRRAVPTVRLRNFAVQNLVASAKCPFTIDLVGIVRAFSARTSFTIELFPGLVFRFDEPKIVFLVFRSGSVVITGASSTETITTMFSRFYRHILCAYQDTGEYADVSNSSEYKRILAESARF